MARQIKFVTVTFDAFWMSGSLTVKERKALTFAKNLHKHHKAFIKEYKWNGKWHGYEIADDQLKLKVTFETIYKPVEYKRKAKVLLNSETIL